LEVSEVIPLYPLNICAFDVPADLT
jgi:hypothetical protein